MFHGAPIEQFHQFISTPSSKISSISSSLTQTPPISTSTNLNFLSFDPLFFPSTHQVFEPQHLLQTPPTQTYDGELLNKVDQEINLGTRPEEIDINDTWSNDEVIQLLKIKSSTENWFRDFTWEHVSRKLAELGYKRGAEKCKEKYDEQACRNFSGALGYNKNSTRYILPEEFNEQHLYHATIEPPRKVNHQYIFKNGGGDGDGVEDEAQGQNGHFDDDLKSYTREESGGGGENEAQGQNGHFDDEPKCNPEGGSGGENEVQDVMVQANQQNVQVVSEEVVKDMKRKRKHKKFEMVQGLCLEIVNKMMTQQEEMHKKVLETIANRDDEKMAREEAWRKANSERAKREIHIREHENAMANDRQTTINEFMNNFTSFSQKIQLPFHVNINELRNKSVSEIPKIPFSDNATKNPNQDRKIDDNPYTPFALSEIPKVPFLDKATKHHNQDAKIDDKPFTPSEIPKIPFSDKATENPNQDGVGVVAKDDIGRRWPRYEVLALINMRCNVFSSIGRNKEENEGHFNNNNGGSGSDSGGVSMWERISKGMLELGYKRSAKRCKEKWENINKYFRKTKDKNKKRSLDSRTCPYYHQLSTLYNQGKLVLSSRSREHVSDKPEKCLENKILSEN